MEPNESSVKRMKANKLKCIRSLVALLNLIILVVAHGQSGVTVPAITNKFYSAAGAWVQGSNTNCVIWNSFPKEERESVTWSGGVSDGKAHGKGTVQWFRNGTATTSYVGEMQEGLAHGYGISKSSKEEYRGTWVRGSLTCTNGVIRYVDGNWYKGDIKDGFKTGHGQELMVGGYRYIGQFLDDRFDGEGKLFMPNGDVIEGEWRNSKLEGIGFCHPKKGDTFKVRQSDAGIERVEDHEQIGQP